MNSDERKRLMQKFHDEDVKAKRELGVRRSSGKVKRKRREDYLLGTARFQANMVASRQVG